MLQIALVSDQHDHDVGVRMVAEFLQPTVHVLVRRMFGNVIHEQGSDSASVVTALRGSVNVCRSNQKDRHSRRSDSPVSFLTRCVYKGVSAGLSSW